MNFYPTLGYSKTYFEHKIAPGINVQNPKCKKFRAYHDMSVEALFFTRRVAWAAKMTEECFAPLTKHTKHTKNTFATFPEQSQSCVKFVMFSCIWSRDTPKISLETHTNEFLSYSRVLENIF